MNILGYVVALPLVLLFILGTPIAVSVAVVVFLWSVPRSLRRIADALEAQRGPLVQLSQASALDKRPPDNWPAHEVKLSAFGR